MQTSDVPCSFFLIYYKHAEYEVFQTDTLRQGLERVRDMTCRGKILTVDDEEMLDALFRLGRDNHRDDGGWGLVAVVLHNKLTRTPYSVYDSDAA